MSSGGAGGGGGIGGAGGAYGNGTTTYGGGGGLGGAGGAGAGTSTGGAGGQGGPKGGELVIILVAGQFTNNGTINSNGDDGADYACGGGAGGGVVIMAYGDTPVLGTINCKGGAGGVMLLPLVEEAAVVAVGTSRSMPALTPLAPFLLPLVLVGQTEARDRTGRPAALGPR